MKVEMSVLLFLLVISTSLVNGSCPLNCSCRNDVSGSFVNCNTRSLGHIPNLPRDTYELYIHYNQISEIPVNTFVDCDLLKTVYLQNNKIRSLESNTFINMTNLYELNLSGNNISNIEERAFVNLTSLSALHLTSNLLNCSCSIYPFWSWLIERASIGTSAKCSDGRFVISLRSAALEKCNHNHCISHDCGLGTCYIEPMNGTAQCVFDDTYIKYCPEDEDAECDDRITNKRIKRLVNDIICVSVLVMNGGSKDSLSITCAHSRC
ncbi:unnamed protein product [Mytilus coruscus]|uniref:LRRNT domain-containing protein n=1 Tax=Mytilus coruscus TaxID=42192 RepID=A0A6J8EGX1_MYTCO|nr:unnamed protein product [Mytilus coruscus]